MSVSDLRRHIDDLTREHERLKGRRAPPAAIRTVELQIASATRQLHLYLHDPLRFESEYRARSPRKEQW